MNKNNLQKLILALVIPALYILSATGINSVSEENFIKASRATFTEVKDFLNIIFNINYNGTAAGNWVERNLPLYRDSLNYNAIQVYDDTSARFGYFETPLSDSQIAHVKGLMSDIEDKELKGFYARTKITWLAEGQRLEYEVSPNGSTTVNNGFCYQNVMSSTDTTDSSRTVLHPKVGINSAGWLCKNIYENMQHCDFVNRKDRGDWFVKPMMRIDTSDFGSSDTTKVVAIVINKFNGDRLDSIVIKVRNFRNSTNTYAGNYINGYNFLNESPFVDLSISGRSDTVGGLNYGNSGYLESSQVDFKVYWYGLVDVWFDKLTVDDELGNNLFKGIHDGKIEDEVSHFTGETSNYTFYCDEAVYSQIPCLEYIKNKMVSYEPDAKLSYVMSDVQNRFGMRKDTVAYGLSLRKVQPKVFFSDPYLIPWEIPDNISYPGDQELTSQAYNDTLQRIFGHKAGDLNIYENSFIKQVDLAREKVTVNSPDSKFFVIPQLFGYMRKDNTGNYIESGLREPTNEEIQAQAMLSVAHGAEGLGWFIYQGSEWTESCSAISYLYNGHSNMINHTLSSAPLCNFYLHALFNIDSTKRRSNLFGQNKWDYVAKMNKKVLNWKPVIDKIKWDNGYSVHEDGANHNFITDIQSIIVHSGPPTVCEEDNINYDCAEERYWEMGFFDPDFDNPAVEDNDKSKYFMMVNRRCVPEINDDGDLRQLRIKFNSSQLSGFNNWKIVELDSNKVVRTFDKDSNMFVDMGIYQPGEGKLYKIAAVMQEGGTLVADEEITPGSFDCKNDVTNDGKNVTINPNVTVNFSEGVKWDFQGGEIKFGGSGNNNTPSPVLFNSTGSGWKGITLNQCTM